MPESKLVQFIDLQRVREREFVAQLGAVTKDFVGTLDGQEKDGDFKAVIFGGVLKAVQKADRADQVHQAFEVWRKHAGTDDDGIMEMRFASDLAIYSAARAAIYNSGVRYDDVVSITHMSTTPNRADEMLDHLNHHFYQLAIGAARSGKDPVEALRGRGRSDLADSFRRRFKARDCRHPALSKSPTPGELNTYRKILQKTSDMNLVILMHYPVGAVVDVQAVANAETNPPDKVRVALAMAIEHEVRTDDLKVFADTIVEATVAIRQESAHSPVL